MSKFNKLTAVIAGAGTGKTYALVENYLLALCDDSNTRKRPNDIVALTFTEKAAQEMKLRVIKRLSSLLLNHEAHLFNLSHDEIKKLLRAIPNAPITTFHGFCAHILRQEAHYFGIRHDFTIMNSHDEIMHANNILLPLLLKYIDTNDSVVKRLLSRFKLASTLLSSGLLDNIISLYFRLLERGLSVSDLSSLRHHRLTSVNMYDIERDIEEFLSSSKSKDAIIKIKDIKNFFLDHKHDLLLEDEYIVAKTYKNLREKISGNFGDNNARKQLLISISNFGSYLLDKFTFKDEEIIAQLLYQFDDVFNQFKKRESLLGYGDLLSKTKALLLNNTKFKKHLQGKIKHILVDEYQDTNPIQEDIISLLIASRDKPNLPYHNRFLDHISIDDDASLFMVGDKKQSIYGFRGADVSLFDRMIKKITVHHGHKHYLKINYRSSKKVIELINLVSSYALKNQQYSKEDNDLISSEGHLKEGLCGLWLRDDDNKNIANVKAAAFGVVNLLSSRDDLEPKDIVILVRRIKAAFSIKQELIKYGVATRIISGEGFYQRQEIVDMISALKLILDPGHAHASMVVFRSPILLFLDRELLTIKLHYDDVNLTSAIKAKDAGLLSISSKDRLAKFTALLKNIREHIFYNGLLWAIDEIIANHHITHILGLDHDAIQKYANLEKLRKIIMLDHKNPIVTIEDLYEKINYDHREPLASTSSGHNEVSIMTIHQSKGLEFKVVVLADGEAKALNQSPDILVDNDIGLALKAKNRPIAIVNTFTNTKASSLSRFDRLKSQCLQKEKEEISRLLYVSLTRAKEEVYIASSTQSFNNANDTSTMVGLFLEAYRHDQDKFSALCDITYVANPETIIINKYDSDPITSGDLFSPSPIRQRVFASNIITHTSLDRHDIAKNIAIDGGLAHKLMAEALPLLSHAQDNDVNDILNALIRKHNIAINNIVNNSINAAKISITMILRDLLREGRIILEMPLSCWPKPHILIEGFADMVYMGHFIGVVEFKSSMLAIKSLKTKMQVLSYAESLQYQFKRPIKYALHLIGDYQSILWQNYDDDARNSFISSLGFHNK